MESAAGRYTCRLWVIRVFRFTPNRRHIAASHQETFRANNGHRSCGSGGPEFRSRRASSERLFVLVWACGGNAS